MARIRSVKPDFFTSIVIGGLQYAERLTFIGLWTYVDDHGRGVDDARLVRAAVWPLDDRTASDVEADLGALAAARLILRYEDGGRRYLAVRSWTEHQRVDRPTPSKFPPPPQCGEAAHGESQKDSRATREDARTSRASAEQGAGSREQGKEQDTTAAADAGAAGREQVEGTADLDGYAAALIRGLNAAMRENPKIDQQRLRPIEVGHGGSQQAARDWAGLEIPLEMALDVVRAKAGAYRPSGQDRQVSSLAYFDAAVRSAWGRHGPGGGAAPGAGGAGAGVALVTTGGAAVGLAEGQTRSQQEIQAHLAAVLGEVHARTGRRLSKEEGLRLAAELVFGYWGATTGSERAMLDHDRERLLVKALSENRGDVGELLYAVDGALLDPWHNGEQDGRKRLGIDVILRNRAKIEELAGRSPRYRKGEPHPMAEKYAEAVQPADTRAA